MHKYLLFGIISTFAVLSVVGLAAVNVPLLAQENMTMNTSEPAPVENTSEISDSGVGLDGNMMADNNMTGMNMTDSNTTGMQ